MKTCDLKQGDNIRLLGFGQTDTAYRRRLFSFGLARGAEVQVVRRAPLGCPIQLDIKGTSLMLRVSEASHLEWEQV